MTGLSGEERFRTTGDLEVTEVPDGYVIYDEQHELVHYLNPTAAVIYTVCDGTRTVADIQALLRDAYDLDAPVELDEVFTSLEEAGLVCRET
jgi:hypothetical protein